jgi:formate dehydrogenase subunit beta
MPDGLLINTSVEQAARDFLRSLLERGAVKGILALGLVGGDNGGTAYSLYADPNAFSEGGGARPLLPVMPANAGGLLSRLTLKGPLTEPIAAVLKPCEIRAFIELVKLNQSSLDNVLLISGSCGGVYPLKILRDDALEEKVSGYWEAVKLNKLDEDIRVNCRSCTDFSPYNADITFSLLGQEDLDSRCTLSLNTEKSLEFIPILEDLGATQHVVDLEPQSTRHIYDQRKINQEVLFEKVDVGLEGLINTFGRCINCHACMAVCPICYCNSCYFESADCEHTPDYFESELERKGGLRLPPDTIFFQLGRLTHMSISCVGCGMCSDVCPADIPVSDIFSKVGKSVQTLFEYQPGRCVTDEIPLRNVEFNKFT